MAQRHTAELLLSRIAEHWREADTPTLRVMMRVYRLNDLVLENARQQVGRFGLSFTAFEVLAALRAAPRGSELLPTELYSAILISSGGLTKVLRGLEGRGLVSRRQSRGDRRQRPMRLTGKGRALAERVMTSVLESDRALLAKGLGAGELRQMAGLLRKLLCALEPTSIAEE